MAGDQVMTSFAIANYSGMLFNKGNTNVPFSTIIAGNALQTNHVEFVTGQEYTTGGGNQPEISENASLTAPDADFITRAQKSNVTQIFQEAVKISYGKQSNMGTLSGLNIPGQTANPNDELAFQVAAKMTKIARDIEYTFINGAYQKAANDNTANKTRGMIQAIESNILEMDDEPLRLWDVAEMLRKIKTANAPLVNLLMWVNATTLFQLTADAKASGSDVIPGARNINGIPINNIMTPLGQIGLYLGEFLPDDTALFLNPSVIGRVEQPVPGKGNFFMEKLAQVGAGDKYQIFGQLGLDHGPEWMHGKITGISTEFIKPESGTKVYMNQPLHVLDVVPTLIYADLNDDTPTSGAAVGLITNFNGAKPAVLELTYIWQISADGVTGWANIEGATAATYTPVAGDVTKFIRCSVTATGTAQGTVVTDGYVVA